MIDAQGRVIPFAAIEPGQFTVQPSEGLTLSRDHDNVYTLEAGSVFFRFTKSAGGHEQHPRLERMEDRNGNVVSLEYDGQGRLTKLDNQSGHLILEYSKTFPERISRVCGISRREAEEKTTPRLLVAYEYDASGRLASIALADGETRRAFTYHNEGPGAGLMASHTLPSGLRCDYEWGAFPDHPRVIRHRSNDDMSWASSYAFLPDGGETTVTDRLGRTRAWRWSEKRLPLSYTNAAGETWQIEWNGQNQPMQCILPNGGIYFYGYDGIGNLSRVTDPEGASPSFTWDGRYPLLLEATDAEGNATLFAYDGKGNRILTRHPNGGEEHFRYDASGLLIERLTPLGDAHRYEWDEAGRLVRYHDCSDHVYSLEYNAYGYLTASTDPLEQTRSIERDILGNPLVLRYPDGSATKYTWDKAGRMTTATDALGAVTFYRYNRQGQLLEEKDALGGIISMRYDLEGNLAILANPNGEKYHFNYDAESRAISNTGLDNVSDEYELDALGLPVRARLAAYTDLETLVSYERDRLGRVTKRSGDTGVTTYRYSPAGRLVRIEHTDAQGQKTSEISRAYDVMGNLVEEKKPRFARQRRDGGTHAAP